MATYFPHKDVVHQTVLAHAVVHFGPKAICAIAEPLSDGGNALWATASHIKSIKAQTALSLPCLASK